MHLQVSNFSNSSNFLKNDDSVENLYFNQFSYFEIIQFRRVSFSGCNSVSSFYGKGKKKVLQTAAKKEEHLDAFTVRSFHHQRILFKKSNVLFAISMEIKVLHKSTSFALCYFEVESTMRNPLPRLRTY